MGAVSFVMQIGKVNESVGGFVFRQPQSANFQPTGFNPPGIGI